MSGWLILLVGAIYLYVAIDLLWRGNMALGATFLGYAFSNVGLYYLT